LNQPIGITTDDSSNVIISVQQNFAAIWFKKIQFGLIWFHLLKPCNCSGRANKPLKETPAILLKEKIVILPTNI
jgi:hypothetical protein